MSDSRFITVQTKPTRTRSTQTQSEKIWRSSLPSWLTVGFALILCAAFVACTGGDAKQQAQAASPHAVSVAIAPVTQQDMPVYLVGLGTVTAFYTANIKSRVDGQIMRVNFQEGQTVKEGDLLILIDPRPYQVQLEQMQAQLFKDQASLRDARLNFDRYTTLIPSGSIAQQQVDTQKATVDQLDGQVRTDQAQIDNAKLELVYCNITAPFTGRVGLRQVDPGNIVHAADTNPMLILTQLQPIAVVFTLPEDQLPTVAQHMKNSTLLVEAYSRDNQIKLATGKLQTIDNQIDQTTGTAKLKAVFDNKDNQLWPNQFVNANLLLETQKKSTVLPTAAILRGPQGTFVYLVKPDKTVEARTVTIALTQGNTTAVASGLKPGDTVVTDGQDKLQTGSKIEARSGAPGNNARGSDGAAPGTPAS
jgi:multidrug efflux system membrane fusion protein